MVGMALRHGVNPTATAGESVSAGGASAYATEWPAPGRALELAREDGRAEVLEWAAKSLRTAVDEGSPHDEARLTRLCDLAEVLLYRFGRANSRIDVQEAVNRLQEAVEQAAVSEYPGREPEQSARVHFLLACGLERWYELDRSLPALGEAARQYREALSLPLPPSRRALAWAGRARVCDQQGRDEEARRAYESCLESFAELGLSDFPDAVAARSALARLRGPADVQTRR
jgi:tetratricopeptide (TPR) repeat protein